MPTKRTKKSSKSLNDTPRTSLRYSRGIFSSTLHTTIRRVLHLRAHFRSSTSENKAFTSLLTPEVFVVAIVSLVVAIISFHFYSGEDVQNFGYTKDFINIAETTIEHKKYSRLLVSPATGDSLVIREVQREPLYPVVLMFTKLLTGNFQNVRYLQFVAYFAVLVMLGLFASRRYGKAVAAMLYVGVVLSPMIAFYFSMMYPYSFQFLLLVVFVVTYLWSVEKGKKLHVLSGLVLGLAILERGGLLFLPLYLFITGFLLELKFKVVNLEVTKKVVVIAYLVVSPWLVRNITQGFFGINQMLGYSLGYTCGMLPSQPETDFEKDFEALIPTKGSDIATLHTIKNYTVSGKGTFVENDKKFVSYSIEKIRQNPKMFRILQKYNFLFFISDFVGVDAFFYKFNVDVEQTPIAYFHEFGMKELPVFGDFAVVLLAGVGVVLRIRKKDLLAWLSVIIITYTYAFSAIVLFSPRYRGFIDVLVYVFAGIALKNIFELLKTDLDLGV